jgi:hypothetical protein
MGFRATRNGAHYQRHGVGLSLERDWLVASAAARAEDDATKDLLGHVGLWKLVAHGAEVRREFHLPLRGLTDGHDEDWEGDDDAGGGPFHECLQWIIASAAGELPSGWQCPSRDEIESWLPPGGLTLQVGPFVRQGLLRCETGCLRLRFPVAPAVRERLPPARWECLRDVLREAQDRWRMVRAGVSGAPEQPAVVAESDLSGAPPAWLECLLKTSVAALRWVTSSLVWSTALLADPHVECRAIEGWQSGHGPRKVRSL